MNALVADVSVAVEPEPVPVVMHRSVFRIAHGRDERRRSGPQIVVDRRWDLLRPAHFADAVATLVAEAARRGDLADVARSDPLHSFTESLAGPDLRTGLNHAPVLTRRVDELSAFPDVVRDGLLEINVLT